MEKILKFIFDIYRANSFYIKAIYAFIILISYCSIFILIGNWETELQKNSFYGDIIEEIASLNTSKYKEMVFFSRIIESIGVLIIPFFSLIMIIGGIIFIVLIPMYIIKLALFTKSTYIIFEKLFKYVVPLLILIPIDMGFITSKALYLIFFSYFLIPVISIIELDKTDKNLYYWDRFFLNIIDSTKRENTTYEKEFIVNIRLVLSLISIIVLGIYLFFTFRGGIF